MVQQVARKNHIHTCARAGADIVNDVGVLESVPGAGNMEAFLAGRSRLKQSSADKTASEKSSSSKLDGRKRIPWVEK